MVAPRRAGDLLFGLYRLERPLGTGMGGETWRAVPVDGGPPVAIKIVSGFDGVASHDALVREAAFLRNLRHPHVVPYVGLLDLPGSDASFLVTELADGTLADWVDGEGPRAAPEAAWLLLQLVDALEAVHAGGVLHRDLKPTNVLVRWRPDGRPHLLLADFGISRTTVDRVARISRGMGTIGYGAPESWSNARITQAADVWSLGAVGWYLLAGRDPEAAPGSLLPNVERIHALAPADADTDTKNLVRLLVRMLALEPDHRPTLGAVREVLAGMALVPAPTPHVAEVVPGPADAPLVPPTRPLPPRRPAPTMVPTEAPTRSARKPAILVFVAIGAALMLTSMVGVAGLLWMWRDTAPEPAVVTAPPPEPARVPTPQPLEPTPVPVAPAPVVSAPVASVPVASAPVVRAPEPGTPAPESDAGPIQRLRVGLAAPNGLPLDATLRVSGPDAEREVANTQVLLETVKAGRWTVEVRTPTRVLGRTELALASAETVRVACSVPSGDFGALACGVQ